MVRAVPRVTLALLLLTAGSLAAQNPSATKPSAAQTDGGFTFRWSSSASGERSFRAQQFVVSKGHVGLQMLNLTEGLRSFFEVPTGVGVLVAEVQSDGPADRAGLQPGDVIVAVDGAQTRLAADLMERLGREGGKTLAFEIVRSGRAVTLNVPIAQQQTRVVRLQPNLGPAEAHPTGDQNEFTEMVSPTDLEFTMDQLRLFVGGEGLRRNVETIHRFDAEEFEAKVRALEQELAALQAQLPGAPAPGGGEPPHAAEEPDR